MATPVRSAQEQFNRQAAHYDNQWNRWSEENLRWLLQHADATPEDRALDVATGAGFTAIAFAPLVGSVVGLDVSTGMLQQAKQRAEAEGLTNLTLQEGAAESLPFPEGAFTLVTCRIAAHHFLSVPAFLKEAYRALAPGGRLLITDTTVPDGEPEAADWQNRVETVRDPSHVRNYTPGEWRQMVEAAGFTVEVVSDTGGMVPVTLKDWLVKAGCTPEQSAAVRASFASAPEAAVRLFQIAPQEDEEIAFAWQRVVLKAHRP